MKVLQVIDHLNVGGAERVLVDLTNILNENQYNVTVLCLLKKAKLDEQLNKNINVIYLHRKNKFNPLYLIKLYIILRKYDVIHIHLRQVLRYVSLLFYTTRLNKKKVIIFQDHFGKIDTEKTISPSIKEAMKRCTAYIGVSDQLTNWAKSNTINSNIFKLSNIVRQNKVGINSNLSSTQIHIVSVGNFRPQKNYEFLCQLIAQSSDEYNYTIYGQLVDLNYYHKIKDLISDLKIEDKVTIITDCDNIVSELPKYHLGLHCATSETGPLVAIEYLSMQIPFVAYNTGEVAMDVGKTFPSFIQKDFNVENWNTNINTILEHRADFVKELKSFFTKKYSEDAYLENCISIYQKLIAKQ
ncbi:glycosyltransferase involved in cell wall biosynthesis [Winogradskyella eximia]|jgi:glycosyltransferase involved in cell wall biosynthesis|uniref:Glycosyltransferase involved in cell wall biosynthesis n=1 Tax=Winogradskyella eximia TaxID=262006 RepID=A0A3D9GPS3_9FLAO|nr:glycosyltransferase [Winogradskyella eximia]RED38220.1 glycosyltransferase involved in cell wall biosynthesis [Winogradskyella eximia]